MRLRDLLAAGLGARGVVGIEFPYRPLGQHEWRLADVGYVVANRIHGIQDNHNGSPELVAEVLSPSNSAQEMYRKGRLCLATGVVEFRVIDLEIRKVRVATNTSPTREYGHGELISLAAFGGEVMPVDDIFTEN